MTDSAYRHLSTGDCRPSISLSVVGMSRTLRSQIAERDVASGAYGHLDSGVAADHRLADQLAAEVASQGLKADVFITRREYLFSEYGRRLNSDLTVLEPEQAFGTGRAISP
jgi:hypothetical protein